MDPNRRRPTPDRVGMLTARYYSACGTPAPPVPSLPALVPDFRPFVRISATAHQEAAMLGDGCGHMLDTEPEDMTWAVNARVVE